jgi:DNA-binding winged helix-turn-helix (wHTH) protein/tetratricopeptide (TPR) repeat protein
LAGNDMGRSHKTQYRFGPYTLEPDERRILGEGASPIELTAKAFDLLALLVGRAEQLVTKDEILEAVWQEVSIAESNVTTTISMIRKALQEDSEHRYIETVPKKGYRFVAAVSVVSVPDRDGADPVDQMLPSRTQNEKRLNWIRLFGLLAILVGTGIVFGVLHFRRPMTNGSDTLYQNGVRDDAEGKDNLAIKELTEVPQSDPKFVEARTKLAWLLYQSDKNDDAKRCLEPVLSAKSPIAPGLPDKSASLKIEGIKQLLTDHPNDALDDFQLAAESDPRDTDALIYIADTAISTGNLVEADKALAKCEAIDRLNPFCGYERIDALTHEGEYDKAITEYNNLRSSNYPWMDQPAGYAELARGNVDEALKHFNSLVADGPTGSHVHFLAAQDGIVAADLLKGEMATALRRLTTAMNQTYSGYEKADYLILMAEIEALHGNSGQVKAELEEASKLSDSPAFAIEIARTYAMIGDDANAQSFLARAQRVEPGLELEYGAADPFIHGLESLRRKDFEMASEQLNTSFSMNQSPETAYFLAKAEMGLGDWSAAINHLNFIIKNKAKVFIDSVASLIPLSEFDLSVCYRSSGQESEANNHLSTARRMWEHADPDLKARFTNSTSNTASKIPRSE